MFKYLSSIALVMLLFVSCSDSASDAEIKHIASFEVEGMVCEMGCGASLRKGLYTTEAVDDVKVEYNEDRMKNIIHVSYSSSKTGPESMLKIIEELNDGQFKAQLVEDKVAPLNDSSESKESESLSSESQTNGIEASTSSFSLPNLTELLNSLIY
jgi:hypothetical protein